MKYIDAEKLIAEIKRRISNWSIREKFAPVGQGKDTCISRVTELSDLLSFIDSLQQEQPEKGLDVTEFCKPIDPGIAKCVADHWWEMLDGKDAEEKQQEVDLEVRKQIEELANDWHHKGFASDEDCPLCMQDLMDILWHFYKLGRKQVLQEIYDGKTKPVDKITAAWLDD